jgi:membrane protein
MNESGKRRVIPRTGLKLATREGMFANLKLPLSWWDLIKRTANEAMKDDVPNLAAQQAYYFFFALFPALLTLISIASFFPIDDLMNSVTGQLGRIAPNDVLSIITDQIAKIKETGTGGILTFGFLLTIWSSSTAMVSLTTTLNAAYDIIEERPWWKVRLTALALTIGLALFILTSIALVIAGPTIAEQLAARMQLGEAFKWTWWILQWPVVLALVATGIAIVYFFAPDAEQEWVLITPGSILATVVWIVVSLGLKLYISRFGNYNETYGTIGGVIVLLLWFWLSGLAILIGAEFNAEIEHASPYGKDVGEKVPGEKKRIGVLAEREFEKRLASGQIPVTPFPNDVNCDVEPRPSKESAGLRPSELLIGTAALIPAAIKIAKEISQKVDRDAA